MLMPCTAVPLGSFGFTLDDALDAQQCADIIELARYQLDHSETLGEYIEGYRTSSDTWLQQSDLPHVLGKLQSLVEEITGLPAANQESIQILRYEVGQEYKDHHDYWHPGTDYYEEQMARGGQRIWSILVYLNEVEEGGGTAFPELEIEVIPERGKLLAWKNVTEQGLNYDSLHIGLPVEQGVKWVAVTWVREQAFV